MRKPLFIGLVLMLMCVPLLVAIGGVHELRMGHDEISDGESVVFAEEDVVDGFDVLVFSGVEHEATAELVNESGEVVYFDDVSDESGDVVITSVRSEDHIEVDELSEETDIGSGETVVFVDSDDSEVAYFYEKRSIRSYYTTGGYIKWVTILVMTIFGGGVGLLACFAVIGGMDFSMPY